MIKKKVSFNKRTSVPQAKNKKISSEIPDSTILIREYAQPLAVIKNE